MLDVTYAWLLENVQGEAREAIATALEGVSEPTEHSRQEEMAANRAAFAGLAKIPRKGIR